MIAPGRSGRADDRLSRIAATRLPEIVAGLVSLLVVVVLVTGGPFGSASSSTPSPGPSDAAVSPVPSAQPTPIVDATLVNLLVTVNDQLAANGVRLAQQAAAEPFRVADVAATIRELNSTARSAIELLPQLERQPGAGPMAARLSEFYTALGSTATAGLQASVSNVAAYRQTAAALATLLDGLPALQAGLQALLLLPPASETPSPVPVATPTAEPTATASPSGSVDPSASPTTLPGGPELITNGGFDVGKAPWILALDPTASGSFTLDQSRFNSAPSAARIAIATPTTSRGAVAVRQSGVSITAGASYVLRVALASSEPREVSIRVASAGGVTYGSRIVVATAGWAVYELPFDAPIGDVDAVVSIELGRSTVTTWIDDVSLREAR